MTAVGLSVAMILAEYDVALVMDTADLVLDFGEVISVGTPDVVQSDPNIIKTYLGEELEASVNPSGRGGHPGSSLCTARCLHSSS